MFSSYFLFSFQVTCRNRKVGKTYSCRLCTKKGFLSKLRLAEHEKRKHPTIVVTSVASAGNSSSVSSSLSPSSHTQSEVVQTTDAQTSLHQVQNSPMLCRTSNTATSLNTSSNVASYSNPSLLPNVPPSSLTSSHRQWENNTYFNHQAALNQHHLMPSSPYSMHPQIQSTYTASQQLNNYTSYGGIHPGMPSVGSHCYPTSPSSSFQQSVPTTGAMTNTSHFTGSSLTTLSPENVPSVGMQHQGEENVGSLMRLVYSCSDNNMEGNYSFSHHEPQTNFGNMDPQQNSKLNIPSQNHAFSSSHLQTINLNNACVMPDVTPLDTDLSRGVCFDWDPFTKIDCKN